MAMHLSYLNANTLSLGVALKRRSDGLLYDFADSTFKATPTTPIATLPALAGNFVGLYELDIAVTPLAQFTDGDYRVTVHNTAAGNTVIGLGTSTMHNGDDATVFPSGAGVDPLGVAIPGSYGPGTTGYILGTNLDAKVSAVSGGGGTDPFLAAVPASYAPGTAGYVLGTNLDAKVSLSGGGNPSQGVSPGAIVVAAPTASQIILGGLAPGQSFTGTTPQRLVDSRVVNGLQFAEARRIASQSYDLVTGHYTFTLGTGTGEDGPFSFPPPAGTVLYIGP